MTSIHDLSGRKVPGTLLRALCIALAMLPAAACGPRQIGIDHLAEGAGTQTCPAGRLHALAGKPFTALATVRLPDGLRILRPGQTVTRDLQPGRLNAQVDGQGRILRLFCG